MPKDMFYKISKEKQNTFISAAKIEFTTKSYSDVSILSISKLAGISRGSFYNYFDTVGDVLEFLVGILKTERKSYAPGLFEKSGNDLFEFAKNLIKYDYDTFTSESNYSLLNNYLQYLSVTNKSFKVYFVDNIIESVIGTPEVGLIDFNNYNISKDEFYTALELLGNSLTTIIIRGRQHNQSKEEIFNKLDFTVNLIKTGLQHYTK